MADQRHGEGEMEHSKKPFFFSSFNPFLFVLIFLPSLVLVSLVCKLDLEVPWTTGLDKVFSSFAPHLLDPAALDLKGHSFSSPIVSIKFIVANLTRLYLL